MNVKNNKERKIELYDYVWTKEDTIEKSWSHRLIPKHTGGSVVDIGFDQDNKLCYLIEIGKDFDEDDPIAGLYPEQVELVVKNVEDHALYVIDHKECQTYEKVKEMYDSDAEEVWNLFNEFKEKGITWDKVMSREIDLSKR